MPVPDLSNMSIRQIALEVNADPAYSKKPPFGAVPYLEAMCSLDSINDRYYEDSGRSVVAYFLGNAQSYRGEIARAVKAELNKRLK